MLNTMRMTLYRVILGLALCYFPAYAFTVVPTNVALTLGQAALSDNLFLTLNSATYVGAALAAGTYTGGPLGIHDGIILTSGTAQAATGSAVAPSTNNKAAGSTLCSAVSGGTSYDASVLTMNITQLAVTGGLTFQFIFASAEYPK
jgi:hypothetical protein